MNKELVIETGQCKLRNYSYPVRIYATDGGAYGSYVHGAYKTACGWHPHIWDKNGHSKESKLSFNLIPMPVTKYFNIYTDYQDIKWTGFLYDTLEEAKESWKQNQVSTAELFSYSEGVVKMVATS